MGLTRRLCPCKSGRRFNNCHGQSRNSFSWRYDDDERQIEGTLLFDKLIDRVLLSGSSAILIVRDLQGRVSALKSLRRERYRSLEMKKRFDREAKVWFFLPDHPNLVPAQKFFSFLGRPFIAMPFYEQGDLTQFFAKNPELRNNDKFVLSLAGQLCDALVHAHANGLNHHGDLKPQNCFIADDGTTAMLGDFGLSRKTGEDALDGETVWMTATFAAPEIVAGHSATMKSDIFSFGAMFFWIVTGEVPPRELGQLEFALAAINSHPLVKLLEHCMRSDPSERFESFASLRSKIQDVAEQAGWLADLCAVGPRPMHCVQAMTVAKDMLAVGDMNKVFEACELGLKDEMVNSLRPVEDELLLIRAHAFLGARRFREARSAVDAISIYASSETRAKAERVRKIANLHPDVVNDIDQWSGMGATSHSHELQMEMYAQQSLIAQERYEEAVARTQRALEKFGEWDTTYINRGNALAQMGTAFEDACRDAFQQALELNPHNKTAYYNFALALATQSRFADALSNLDTCLYIDPLFPQAWAAKARLLRRRPELAEQAVAHEAARRAVETDPENSRVAAEMRVWFSREQSF